MKKHELKKKLSLYSMASGAMALMTNNAEAQVTYIDITPDHTMNTAASSSYMLDLNNDGTNDFEFDFNLTGPNNRTLYINAINGPGNGILGKNWTNSSNYEAVSLPSGNDISATPTTPNLWAGSGFMAGVNGTSIYGEFRNATDKYIGLRLKSGADYYYGWVRLTINISTPSITIKDRAFHGTLNTSIQSGQGATTAVEKNQELVSNTVIFVNDINEVMVSNNNDKEVSAELIALSGNVLSKKEIGRGQTNTFEAKDLMAGIYLVKITMGDAIIGKKVVIK